LLTVGYLSGFAAETVKDSPIRHLVVNGAFNPGNSGGPLFQCQDDKVIGIVVSKHAPITPFLQSTLDALSKNPSGFIYTATDEGGNKKKFSEAQIVAELLSYFREMTQVVIGKAIDVAELKDFLKQSKYPHSFAVESFTYFSYFRICVLCHIIISGRTTQNSWGNS